MRTEATALKEEKMCKKGQNWKKHKSDEIMMEGGGRNRDGREKSGRREAKRRTFHWKINSVNLSK